MRTWCLTAQQSIASITTTLQPQLTDQDIVASVATAAKSDTNDNDYDTQLGDTRSQAVRVPTAAETVEHLQQAILWFETTLTDSVKIKQLANFLAVAKRAHYDGQKQTKLVIFQTQLTLHVHWLTAIIVWLCERKQRCFTYTELSFQYNAVLTITRYGQRCRITAL